MAEIRMPKMGDGMEEGTILRWLKKEGDILTADEPIAEIETDKANVEIPAEEAGVLTRILVAEGQTVPVGAVIAIVGSSESETPPKEDAGSPAATAPESTFASSQGIRTPASQAPVVGEPEAERIKASPLARRMARELNIDLAKIRGTGPGGRVVERDITAFVQSGIPQPELPGTPPAPLAPSLEGTDREVGRMRKAIARRTTLSKQTVPHFYLTMPIDMDAALRLREEMNAATPADKISVNDLVVKACAQALVKFPEVNVSYTPEDRIRQYHTVNIGIAVGTDNGLTLPVIPECHTKTLRQISAEAKRLIELARSGSLTPQQMSGGTFSVTNLGMFGIEEFAAIINPPEAAILAVGAVAPEVMAAPDGSFQTRHRMRVTLSCDHRAVDGLLGARFLQEVKRLLENPYELVS
ncbi:MAG: dihydrolipoamide acetyltransferase family protein [Chthonomonadales bacterium]